MSKMKRSLALLLALVMVLSLVPAMHVHAEETGETETAAGESSTAYEPWAHGYRFVDILNWTPETDEYAEELVASVPLQDRIDTYAATQANPELIDDAELYVISSSNYRNTDTTNGPWNGGMAYDEFGYNLFKFWQYADYTGAGGRPTEQIDQATKEYIGSFEYGTIAIPIAAATNAAHKNGVLSLAEYFTPRVPQYTEEWLYQDENGDYPYARKLVEIAEYYGFDGYFINQEEYIPESYVPLFRDMIKWMVEQGLYIQWYDSIGDSGYISYQNEFNDFNDGWLWNEEDGNVANSIFLNYWYGSTALADSKAHAESLGLDPYDTVFMGVEGGQWKFGTDIESRYNAVDENGQPYTSFAIWGSDWYQDQYDRADNNRYQVAYQWGVEERERLYFTSATENAGTYSTGTVTRDDVEAGTINFQGFSKYVVEKSVIDGTAFATDFNNGHGMQYFVNGEVSRDMEWSNLNLQDILPTWQWWMETEGEALTLDMDWDYGSKFTRVQGEFPYTQVGAYNGGSSLVIYGDLSDTHLVNLYKTELDVTANSAIELTYHKTSADDASSIGVAVTFMVDETTTETVVLPIENSGKQTGWTTATVDLGAYAGRTIAAISLELSAAEPVTGYQINLGRLVVTDGADYTPAAPENVVLEKFFDATGEIQLSWDLADYDTVRNYHIYAIYADGTERFVGGAYAANYYIQTLENAQNVTALEVRAVGVDGSESAGTAVSINGTGKASGITAVSADNVLTVNWTDAEGVASVEVAMEYFYSNEADPAAVTVDAGVQSASFAVPVEDGQKYILSLTGITADGIRCETVNYFGVLADNYCAPFDGEARVESAGTVNWTTPSAGDWMSVTMVINGTEQTFSRFGSSCMERISVGAEGLSTVTVTVTDMDGNTSAPVTILFLDGELADLTSEYGEDRFPDAALLEALRTLVGPTLGDLIGFAGALDLSDLGITDLTGLAALTGLTELNLSGNPITVLTADLLPSGLTKLTLDRCEVLERIELDGLSNLELVLGELPALTVLSLRGCGDFPLDLSGCPELYNLYLDGTRMTALDIIANVKLHNFTISGSEITSLTAADADRYTDAYYWVWNDSKLDLTASTAEGVLMEGMKSYFAAAELPDEIGDTETVVGGEWFDCWYGPQTVIDLGAEYLLSSFGFEHRYASWYGVMGSGTIELSSDGETYTTAIEFTDGAEVFTKTLTEAARARYIRLTNLTGNEAWMYVTVNGYVVAPKGFTYSGQQPAMVKNAIEQLTVADDGADYQVLDLLNAWYASAHTVASGTYAADLTDADWIDDAYLTEQSVAPKGVKVVITDSQGNAYTYPTEGPTLGSIESTKLSVAAETVYTNHQYSNEEGYRMFDGSAGSKWCGNEWGNWLVFELEEPRVVGQWYTMHAGSEGAGMISAAFRLQVLNTEVLSEEEYLAMDENGKRSVARTASNWTDLSVVTGNTANEVTVEVGYDALKTAQVYRFVVDEAAQPDGNSWGALRVYEMELYAYEGQLGENVNGKLKADAVESYHVSYLKSGTELNSTTVTVEHALCQWYLESASTCTESGVLVRSCAHCGYREEVLLGKAEHNCEAVVTAPTCEGVGYTTYTCVDCGHSYVSDIVAALGHSYTDTVVEPTCLTMGYTLHTCAACGHSYMDSYTDALEHELTQTVTVEPTCTSEGEMTVSCVHAGCDVSYTVTLPKADHVTEATVVEPTCESYGYTINRCVTCEHNYVSDVVEPLGHAYGAWDGDVRACERCGDEEYRTSRFADVDFDDYFFEAVQWAVDNGITTGTTETTFSPEREVTRAEVVTFLWRAAGSPEPAGNENPFVDVTEADFYYKAVLWAVQNGVTNGLDATHFGPMSICNRAQVVTFLHRSVGKPEPASAEHPFTDVTEGDFYFTAMLWAVESGVTNGLSKTTFGPNTACNRAQIVTFLYRANA